MLTGKTAVVTGGSRGIGAAIVRKLASQGANVAVVYAGSQALAEELCAQCAAEFSGKAVAYRCDVADFTAVKDLMAQIKKEFGTVDILVNNAGVTQDGLLAMMKEESFDRVLDVDLKGAFNCIRHCAGMFLRQKHGAIVNVSSVSGMIGNPGQANCSAAKAGLIGLTKAVAKELARFIHPRNVRMLKLEGKKVEHETLRTINIFLTAYFLLFALSTLLISLDNFDLITSFTSVAATLNNIGPGLEIVGPMSNFSAFSGLSKCVLMFDMLAGRLELFPMLLLFVPATWKRN